MTTLCPTPRCSSAAAVLLALALGSCCNRGAWVVRDSAQDDLPGVTRLAPPAPSVGLYDLVAHPDGHLVYVSNLHVPFVTVVDASTGEWSDALDLRDFGEDHSTDPRLEVAGGALWVLGQDRSELLRWSLDDHAALEPLALDVPLEALETFGDEVWVVLPGELRRYDGLTLQQSVVLAGSAQAISVDDEHVALLSQDPAHVTLLDRDGGSLWSHPMQESWLNDVLLVEDEVWVADRQTGDVIVLAEGGERDRRTVGVDAFALARHEDEVLVTCRQQAGAEGELVDQGAPGTVVALDSDLEILWEVEADLIIRHLAWDGHWWWTAAEDAMRLVAVDADLGERALLGPRLGLTLDHVSQVEETLFLTSHLTDELFRLVLSGGSLETAEVCGWPLVSVEHEGRLAVICQESGELWSVDPESLAVAEELDLADSFHPPCSELPCMGRDLLVDMTVHQGVLSFTDPQLPGVRWAEGREPVEVPMPDETSVLQHFGLGSLAETLLVFEPRADTLWQVEADSLGSSLVLDRETPDFPIVIQGERAWVGGVAVDESLTVLAELPEGAMVVWVNESWLLAEQDRDLVVHDTLDLEEVARVSKDDLRSPPLGHASQQTGIGPLRYLEVEPGVLAIVNSFRGTIELRSLPELEPVGSDDVLALGRWEDLEGLR